MGGAEVVSDQMIPEPPAKVSGFAVKPRMAAAPFPSVIVEPLKIIPGRTAVARMEPPELDGVTRVENASLEEPTAAAIAVIASATVVNVPGASVNVSAAHAKVSFTPVTMVVGNVGAASARTLGAVPPSIIKPCAYPAKSGADDPLVPVTPVLTHTVPFSRIAHFCKTPGVALVFDAGAS